MAQKKQKYNEQSITSLKGAERVAQASVSRFRLGRA